MASGSAGTKVTPKRLKVSSSRRPALRLKVSHRRARAWRPPDKDRARG